MDPWSVYDRLLEPLPDHVVVRAGAVGLRWSRVLSSEDGLGIAYSHTEQSRPALSSAEVEGAPLREVAALVKSWNLTEAGLGLAALNAWYSAPGRAAENGFSPAPGATWPQVFDPFADRVRGKVVSVIGHFPFAQEALSSAAEVRMLERSPRPGDFPDPACEYLLPDSDVVFISSSAFVNKTMPRLLDLAAEAFTVVLGPSTPLSPVLFEHGVDAITGTVPAPGQAGALYSSLGAVGMAGMHRLGRRVQQERPTPRG